MLEIKLLGTGYVRYFGRELVGFPSQLPNLLFCYLMLNRYHPQNREHLAAVFWDDCQTVIARKHLRNTLWRLRQILQSIGVVMEEYFFISEDSISFIKTSSYWLDIEPFEAAVTRCQDIAGHALTEEQAQSLEYAVSLYSDDLLMNLYEDWCLYDRERLRLLYLNTLSQLMLYHGSHGTYERGIQYGERILSMDSTREKVHRQMMWLHWLAGERSAALSQYQVCRQVLRDELGLPPMPVTRQLYEQMRDDHFQAEDWFEGTPSSGSAASPANLRPASRKILEELHHLQEMIEAARAESQRFERLVGEILNRDT
jgi:DNA-binding SARP family transcriptional activator